MKILFVGPSLPDAATHIGPDIILRPPARQGDVMRAIADGATAIGLIDGLFENVAPIWHKEILFALSKGIPVLGAASMGALRAAECAPFGMIGIGEIFAQYADGRRVDDSDVALLHGPPEMKYAAVSVPMVNVEATLACAAKLAVLHPDVTHQLLASARSIFYKERTWRKIATTAGLEWDEVALALKAAAVDQKRLDALALVQALSTTERMPSAEKHWKFHGTPLWRRLYGNPS
ncbi:TfuA-like protein [Allorhizobium pseudoryzae]|uniref:TfuA-like protein n=1 Tax=Allorhizobium pseudoryzae TaxID=379684 RepID=UPI003D037617